MPAAKKPTPFGRLTLVIDPTTSPYARSVLREVLDHAGFFCHEVLPVLLPSALEENVPQVVVLAGNLPAKVAEPLRAPLEAFFARGGGIVALGGSGAPAGQAGTGVIDGLFELFGLRPILNESFVEPGFGQSRWHTLGEGWLKARERRHPVLGGLDDVPLHVFGGQAVLPTQSKKTAAKVLATLVGVDGKPRAGAALAERAAKTGATALFVAADLAGSAAMIRTGRPVDFDAVSAPDGTAPVADGLLKAEDGIVLDFLRDRRRIDEKGRAAAKSVKRAWPIFDQPIADALSQMLVRAICHAAQRSGVALPRLWYYPDGLDAVGHISHDTDGNEPDKAEELYRVMAKAGVRSTWCTLHPGYAAPFYEQLKAFGHEIALHYDAMETPHHESFRRWGQPNFSFQLVWLCSSAGLTGNELATNKNHFTRWEGSLEFLEWCARDGIRIDQSRGPSKRGTIGFPFGSGHPYFLYDRRGRRIDCMEQPFQTQDLVSTAPVPWGRMLVERAKRWHGVCHLLFHPSGALMKGHGASILDATGYGKRQGLRWLTAKEIDACERARRACVERPFEPRGSELVLRAPKPLAGATFLVLGKRPFSVNGSGKAKSVKREGFAWTQVSIEKMEGETVLR